MEGSLVCFECGKELSALPTYLGSLRQVRIRCAECALRAQLARPIPIMNLESGERKQTTISRPRTRPKGELSPEAFDRLFGVTHAI